jgi:hypothetical protein
MEPITIFRASTGLNTRIDPARITFDPQTGIADLAVAVNVNIDATGRVGRRKGFAATAQTGSCHSLWSDGGDNCFFASGTSLYALSTSYEATRIATVTAGAPVSYFALDGRTYWMNGYERGYIEQRVNNAWERTVSYVGPANTRSLSDPPLGHLIAYGFGRVFVAQGSTVWYSEPFDLNAFDLSKNFLPFEGRISMMRLLAGGMWVSTNEAIFFLPGGDPLGTGPVKMADYAAINGTDAEVDLSKIGGGEMNGIGVIWTATNGICIGTPDGLLMNLTQRKFSYPKSVTGAGICFDDRYVTTIEP